MKSLIGLLFLLGAACSSSESAPGKLVITGTWKPISETDAPPGDFPSGVVADGKALIWGNAS